MTRLPSPMSSASTASTSVTPEAVQHLAARAGLELTCEVAS